MYCNDARKILDYEKEILEMYEIIIDEDILMTLFKNSASISFDEINEILYRAEFSAEICQRLDSIMKLPDGCIEWSGLRRLLYGELDKLYEKELNVTASIADFMASDIIYVDQYQKQVHFLGMKKLPDVKMIIVSATLNEKLYRDCFENRNISYMKVPAVKYKGKLKQYIAYSMSRSFIAQVGIERIRNSINRITKIPSVNEITFKKVRKNGDIYFGKTEGFNQYQGQNLVVLGTPHNVPFIYKMIGKYLNYDIRKDLNVKRVEYNGCSFKIMTFEDVDMRNLQFYFLESELEQAIGRARLLRFDCTVYLFSNFPCKQAEIIQEDYLELENLSNHLLTEDTE